MTKNETELLWQEIETRIKQGEARMDNIETLLQSNADIHVENAKLIAENTAITKEIRETFDAVKNGFKVLGWFGVVAKFIGTLAAAGTAVWAAYYAMSHGGKAP